MDLLIWRQTGKGKITNLESMTSFNWTCKHRSCVRLLKTGHYFFRGFQRQYSGISYNTSKHRIDLQIEIKPLQVDCKKKITDSYASRK